MKIDQNQHNTAEDDLMAQINITLKQDEILHLLSAAREVFSILET